MKKTANSLHLQLNKSGYICEERFALGISHAITTKPVGGAFLFGPAGTGKSYLPMMLAEILKRKLFFFQCSPGTREDDLVLKMLPSEETKSGIAIEESVVYESAVKSNDEKVILVLDEWDKTRPTADGFFLDFLQYGRLSIPGRSIRANLSNMTIFFTSNNERDISEALLRRFPKIDVNPLGVDIVNKALSLTHKGHPHIGNVLSLYYRTLQSGMTKPATIQEIRQLLDAVTSVNSIGAECDWDELVYMYITKTPENHELLRSVQDKDINDPVVNQRNAIDVSAFGVIPTAKNNGDSKASRMPHLIDVKCIDASFEMSKLKVAPKDVTCMLEYDDDNYTDAVALALNDGGLTDNPADLHWATVSSGAIVSGKLRLLKDIAKYYKILQMNTAKRNVSGEVMFVEPYVTYNNMCEFVSINSSGGRADIVIKKATDKEIIGKWSRNWKAYDVDFRWTAEAGFEVIIPANTGAYDDFIYMCNNTGGGGINWYYGTTDGYAPEQSVMCMLSDIRKFYAYGEFTAKNTVGAKDYAYYTFNHSPAGCDRASNYSTPQLEPLSSKVTRTSRLTTYKGSGFEVKLHNRIKNGVPGKWSIRITDVFDSELLYVLDDWITYEATKFPLYVSIKAPGYAIGDELCSKYGWTRISDRLLSAKGSANQYCILYEDVITFVCCINYKRMSSDREKANDMIKKSFIFLNGWRKAGSTLVQ
tara:strand:- start:1095 stop:3206 length:2112 start_codon:yes stop_codon:yes gene_type:complete